MSRQRSQQRKRSVKATDEIPQQRGGSSRAASQEVKLKVFVPTQSQKELINTIRENTLTFVDSPAGTGKSSTVLWHFAKEYLTDNSKDIIVVRTPVEFCDDKIGYLPNGLDQKLEVHFASSRKILEEFLGKGKVECDVGKRIHFKIPNYMLGCTLTNSLVLIDESQQLSPQILKLLLERIGEGSKVVVCGDSNQLFDARGKRNGLADAIDRFFKEVDGWLVPKYDDIGYHEFEVSEIMRSAIVKTVVTAYNEEY